MGITASKANYRPIAAELGRLQPGAGAQFRPGPASFRAAEKGQGRVGQHPTIFGGLYVRLPFLQPCTARSCSASIYLDPRLRNPEVDFANMC